jgi:dihydrodipicolinate synthase/N-acetylneuraminate lyase
LEPGVYAAALTPHRREGHEADFAAMLELVDFLGKAGVKGVCLLGATGEFLNIKYTDRVRLVHLAVKRSRVPVLVGVSHSTLDGALELASEAISSGAAGLLLMPPYFFRYEQADILEFYLQFSKDIGRATPIFLYNIPAFTNAIEFDTARQLLATGRFAGIKDSSGDLGYFSRLLELRAELGFTLFAGHDRIFTQVRQAGADGVISGPACAVPELLVALDRAVVASDRAKIDLLDCKLREFLDWIERFPVPVGVKTAATARKLKTGPLAVPLSPEKTAMLEEFQRWFKPWLETLKHVS